METFTADRILRLWERGAALPPVARALALLEGVSRGQPMRELSTLTIGERDRRLLDFREALLGPRLASISECPHCGTMVEFALDASELRERERDEESAPLRLAVDGYQVGFRLLDSDDLGAAARCGSVAAARDLLVRRSVTEARQGEAAVDPADLPEPVVRELSNRMAAVDSGADIALELSCPECAGGWSAPFDIASFLWAELNAKAKRLLAEVHTLAWAYGWSEKEILSMSEARRQCYLAMVQSA